MDGETGNHSRPQAGSPLGIVMPELSHKGKLSSRNGSICQFELDRIEYGELYLCETMFLELVGNACRELLGKNWRDITTFDEGDIE